MLTDADLLAQRKAEAAHLHIRHDLPRWIRHRRKPRLGTRPKRDTRAAKYLVDVPWEGVRLVHSREKKRHLQRQHRGRVLSRYQHGAWETL